MSRAATDWAWQMIGLSVEDERHISSSSTKLVLLQLADRARNGTWKAWPSIGRIAQDTGTTPNTVRQAIRELAKLNLITAEKSRGGAPTNTRVCTLNVDTPAIPAGVEPVDNERDPFKSRRDPFKSRHLPLQELQPNQERTRKEPRRGASHNPTSDTVTDENGDTFMPGSGWVRNRGSRLRIACALCNDDGVLTEDRDGRRVDVACTCRISA